jgi:polysaccharide pyruvyl transferase WcaK-like protein
VRELAESVALVDLAGVSFIDGRERFLPFNILTILPAMLLDTPVFKLAQAMGPFKNPLNRLASRILRHCALVVPRGEVTLGHMSQIAFPVHLMHPAPDVAFLFESRDSLSDEGFGEAAELAARAQVLRAEGRAVVGLCPSALLASKAEAEGWDYIGFMASLTSALIADGHSVLLFPNATRAGSEKYRNNDLPVIAAIAERTGATGADLLAVHGDVNAAALRVILKSCSCVAVSRFHAMVGALSIGLPVAVVGWSHKYLEVMKRFGLEDFVFDYSTRDVEGLRAVVNRLLADAESHRDAILDRLGDVRAESLSQYERMFRTLDGPAPEES